MSRPQNSVHARHIRTPCEARWWPQTYQRSWVGGQYVKRIAGHHHVKHTEAWQSFEGLCLAQEVLKYIIWRWASKAQHVQVNINGTSRAKWMIHAPQVGMPAVTWPTLPCGRGPVVCRPVVHLFFQTFTTLLLTL